MLKVLSKLNMLLFALTRHDIDSSHPRSQEEIFESNRMIENKMTATFGNQIKLVPSIGNNDIYRECIENPIESSGSNF
jgi:hypothetical protein